MSASYDHVTLDYTRLDEYFWLMRIQLVFIDAIFLN